MAKKVKRVLVVVEGGLADAKMDIGVEWEVIDWDSIKSGHDEWTHDQIDKLVEWGGGLITAAEIVRLRAYVGSNTRG